jgi:quercetin dioxygenase-like cupin family protein
MHADRNPIAAPRPAPDPLQEPWLDGDTAPRHLPLLLDGLAMAPAGVLTAPANATAVALRRRLLERAGRSARQLRGMVNVRRADITAEQPAPGVHVEPLYRARAGLALRPGEPLATELWILEPGVRFDATGRAPNAAGAEEWLMLDGRAKLDDELLVAEDFLRCEGAPVQMLVAGAAGVRLLRRVAPAAANGPAVQPRRKLQRGDSAAAWVEFGPGIQRRLLHAEAGGAAAMLYRTVPGATVPHHGHGHDEECYMVEGELFLDDLLLRRGEYQLAPAGSEHGSVSTDTGTLLYVHGDMELDLRVG